MKIMKLVLIEALSHVYMAQFDLKNAVVTFKDGTAVTPKSLAIKVGDGNITFNETKVRQYVLDRGRLSTVRNGDESPMDVTIDIIWEELKAVTSTVGIPSPEDVLKQRGNASTWKSTDSDLCAPYAIDIQILYDPVCQTQDIEQILLVDFRYEKLDHDSKAGMLKCIGKCNAKEASITRIAQTA